MQEGNRWLTVKQAAPLLGLTEQGLRKRIRTGTVETREHVRGNRKRLLVLVEHPVPLPEPNRTETSAIRVAQLETKVEQLERRGADLTAERDRLLTLVEQMVAERRPPKLERRRWPGLWPALVRFWRGKV